MIPRRWSAPSLGLKARDLRVAIAIFSHGGKPTTMCFPSITTISRITGIDARAVKRCLRRLQAKGLITVTERSGTTSLYEIVALPTTPSQRARATPGVSVETTPPVSRRATLQDPVPNHLQNRVTNEGTTDGLRLLKDTISKMNKTA